jgi:hypothetical protein
MRKPCLALVAACLLLPTACADDTGVHTAEADPITREAVDAPHADADHVTTPAVSGADGGTGRADLGDGNDVTWKTDEFELKPRTERYLCFTKTLEEDLVIDGYSTEGQPFVHHLIFVRARAPEPEGFQECNIAFRAAWDPIFIAGAGEAQLAFPRDAGHKLKKGTQVLLQMHLLNTSDEVVRGAVDIRMHRSALQNPRPVSSYVFGTAAVKLPPKQVSQVVGDCTMREPVELIAGFPHMHLLGTGLKFEAGPTAASMKTVFERVPYSFHTQTIETVNASIAAGDATRVTCTYNNRLSQEVTYGESTNNEMCYFIGFAVDRAQTSGCVAVPPPSLSAEH